MTSPIQGDKLAPKSRKSKAARLDNPIAPPGSMHLSIFH